MYEISTRNKVLIWLIGTAVAVFINCFPLPFFSGAQFIFGNIFTVAIAAMLGWRYALPSVLLASYITHIEWNHYFAILPFVGEVLAVGWARDKDRSITITGIFYWLTIGLALVVIQYGLFSDYLGITKAAIALKYIVNGIIGIGLGRLLARVILIKLLRVHDQSYPIAKIIMNATFGTVVLAACVPTYFWLQAILKLTKEELSLQLKLQSQAIATTSEDYIDRYQAMLRYITRLNPNAADPSSWPPYLDQLHNQFPLALTLLVTDTEGKIIATSPAHLLDKVSENKDVFVSDREYFLAPRDTGQPYVSQVFKGRGFGSDPLIAVSAPYLVDGEFGGIAEISLNLDRLKKLDTQVIDPQQGLLILDKNNSVVYSSGNLGYSFLEDLTDSPIARHATDPQDYFVITENGQYLVTSASESPQLGWTIISTLPRVIQDRTVAVLVVQSVLLLFAVLIIAYITTNIITKRSIAGLRQIITTLANTVTQDDFSRFKLPTSQNGINEFDELQSKLNEFADRLRGAFDALAASNSEKENLNAQLSSMNKSLEQLVAEKTKDLQKALQDANSASAAKSEFLASMSHEIRTPMNGMIGMLTMLEESELDDSQRHDIRVAKSSADQLLALLNDILDLSKVEALQLSLEEKPINLAEIASDAVTILRNLAEGKGLELTLDTAALSETFIMGDKVRLRQLLSNLISNAIKFTEEGSVEVTIGSKADESKKGNCIIACEVADTGIGIPIDKQKLIFERFSQADSSTTRRFGGTGLGLAICKGLIELMGGKIGVFSTVGEGSKFYFQISLPIADMSQASDESIRNTPATVADILPAELDILVVEDNKINQMIVQKMLTKKGFAVEVAEDGAQAMAALSTRDLTGRLPDIILMDCLMPNVDGYQATRRIREGACGQSVRELPIVAMTANAMAGDKEACLTAGMNDYVSKPIDPDKMFEAMARALKATSKHKPNAAE